ncbi:hypothetical protein ACU4HD_12110 [Cupriavidus basilensis]
MKKLYARLVLWLIRPALKEHQRRTLDEAINSTGTLSDEALESELVRRGRIEPDATGTQAGSAPLAKAINRNNRRVGNVN